MTRGRIIAVAVAILVIVGVAALILTRKSVDASDGEGASVTATVTTSPVLAETLTDTTTIYGVVQADPAGTITLAAPRAVILTRVLVQAGQSVVAGQPLIEMVSAPTADLGYRQAIDAVTAAQRDIDRVQRLFDEHLAASDQLIAAKKTVADARAALAGQQAQGAAQKHQTLTAAAPSIVTTVSGAPGDHIAQDAPLIVLVRKSAVDVKLGFEPSAGAFAIGQAVTIRPVSGGPAIASHLTLVGRAADQATKTLVAVAPLNGAALAIGAGVEARVSTGDHHGLAVPRAAVVFDETGEHLFVIASGKARRVFVTAGRNYGDQVEVSGPIAAGQMVAVQGAYELQDGMAVKSAVR